MRVTSNRHVERRVDLFGEPSSWIGHSAENKRNVTVSPNRWVGSAACTGELTSQQGRVSEQPINVKTEYAVLS